MASKLDGFLTVKEFCTKIGIAPSRVCLMIKLKELDFIKKGRFYLIPAKELEGWKEVKRGPKTWMIKQ